MRIKRYVLGAAIVALAVGYCLYRRNKAGAPKAGNGKGLRRKAAASLKKTARTRRAVG
ncbi:MAG: hypothetical protein WC943_09260 [Elusimicrobiota bacterium]|jgi:hypothetical protein